MTTNPDEDDALLFAEGDDAPETATVELPPWRVLVVDDEPEVHKVTDLALANVRIDGRLLAFEHAYDGAQARAKMTSQGPYALVLLDVVMLSENDGLEVAGWIRKELRDDDVRIVLRTGQPGAAPEREVMLGYDINDYQPKAELSSQRLVTAVVSAIRAYRDICTIAAQKAGLTKIIDATASLYDRNSIETFVTGVLEQLAGLMGRPESAMFFQGPRALFEPSEPLDVILAATGRFQPHVGKRAVEVLHPERAEAIRAALRAAQSETGEGYAVFSLAPTVGNTQVQAAIYIEGWGDLNPWHQRLLRLFCANAASAFENQRLHHEQRRLLDAFSRFVPARMLETLGATDVTRVDLGDLVQRDVTVMFLDIRSFTRMAERLGPRATFGVLNRFYSRVVPMVDAEGGVVDKYLGDGFLALFPDNPVGAVRAALAIARDVDEARRIDDAAPLDEPLEVGVGIHRGSTVLGLVGSPERMETTAISDAVNVASRLERLTRLYGARILVSGEVFADLPEELRAGAREFGPQAVRGKVLPVDCFELVQGESEGLREEKFAVHDAFKVAIGEMRTRNWNEAARRFDAIGTDHPRDLGARAMAEECRRRARGWSDYEV